MIGPDPMTDTSAFEAGRDLTDLPEGAILTVIVSHDVPGTRREGVTTRSIPIPPYTNTDDLKAFFAYEIEMTAVQHVSERIGHEEFHKALRAATARMAAVEQLHTRMPRTGPTAEYAAAIAQILAATNEEAIDQWEEPSGD